MKNALKELIDRIVGYSGNFEVVSAFKDSDNVFNIKVVDNDENMEVENENNE